MPDSLVTLPDLRNPQYLRPLHPYKAPFAATIPNIGRNHPPYFSIQHTKESIVQI